MNNRVLVVDDEPSILNVCRKVLGQLFSVDTAESGEKGLELIRNQGPYAAIITDLRMGGMDGMEFLSYAKAEAPDTEFLIQTGYADRDVITKAIKELGVSRILVKPWSAPIFRAEVMEAVRIYERRLDTQKDSLPPYEESLPEDTDSPTWKIVQSIVAELKAGKLDLPVLPQVVLELQKVLKKPNSTIDDLATVIEKDAVVSLKLISVAGSYVYRGQKRISTVKEAIPRLGNKEVENIIITLTNKKLYEIRDKQINALAKKLWLHSLCCAYGSKGIARELNLDDVEKYFLMGLIHDIGKVLIVKAYDDQVSTKLPVDMEDFINTVQESHTSLGGILLRHWRFPKSFISVATLHEDPFAFPHVNQAVFVIHLANLISRKIGYSLFEEDIDFESLASATKLTLSATLIEEIAGNVTDLMNEVSSIF